VKQIKAMMLGRCFPSNKVRLKKIFGLCMVAASLLIIFYWNKANYFAGHVLNLQTIDLVHKVLVSEGTCKKHSVGKLPRLNFQQQPPRDELNNAEFSATRSPAKVLLVTKTSYSATFQIATEILTANRVGFKASVAGKNLPDLIKLTKGTGKYGVIFFEDYRSYLEMDKWNRELLDKYCRTFRVGIVAFVPPPAGGYSGGTGASRSSLLVDSHTEKPVLNISVKPIIANFTVASQSSMLRIVKGAGAALETMPRGHWVTFQNWSQDDVYQPVLWAHNPKSSNPDDRHVTVLQDSGGKDSIPKVLFGIGRSNVSNRGGKMDKKSKSNSRTFVHWLQKLLFVDAIHWTGRGRVFQLPLTRHIQVDIDDVFVGKNRLLLTDVKRMLESQETIANIVPGFRYNLGFSGRSFKSGSEAENMADDYLIDNRDRFWWFPHDWNHIQPHLFDNATTLEHHMQHNKQFAEDHRLDINNNYSVSPHHSGIYPVHDPLYESWKSVWDIRVTSTEEYPHLHPARLRRGFQHQEISVLPRQTCGLFTHTMYYDEYPKGSFTLERSIRGGELFQTIAFNPISIFMTHMPNYAFDRLAPYTFESVLSMLQCYTNIEFKAVPPMQLADIYFKMFPEEKLPIWGNPCDDDRHLEIWSEHKSCTRLPDVLVIGPQKTGTTALYTFLQIHPMIRSNLPSPTSFEEPQFFSNNKNYEKGVDWYMDFFPSNTKENSSQLIEESPYLLFEKSATYFDRDYVPERAHRLLRDAKLVSIIISPAKRAYSWYQHMIAHQDPTASKHTFYEIITAKPDAPKNIRNLQARCLEPGRYVSHLERWLSYYKSQQLTIIDGEELVRDPVTVMDKLQYFLSVQPIDYSKYLKFDAKKGFFCKVVDDGSRKVTKCLGKGKGRSYEEMDSQSRKYLQEYYRLNNEALLKLLKRFGYNIPQWLKDELQDDVQDEPESHLGN